MRMKLPHYWLAVAIILGTAVYALAEETITLVTYYPSPRGVYNMLRVGSGTVPSPTAKLHVVQPVDPDPLNPQLEFAVRVDDAENDTTPFVIDQDGKVGVGMVAPQSALHVANGLYAQFENNGTGPPPAGDCDSDAERGRLFIETTDNRLYICNGAARSWDWIALTDN